MNSDPGDPAAQTGAPYANRDHIYERSTLKLRWIHEGVSFSSSVASRSWSECVFLLESVFCIFIESAYRTNAAVRQSKALVKKIRPGAPVQTETVLFNWNAFDFQIFRPDKERLVAKTARGSG